MKRILPLLALSALFVAAPAFAADDEAINQVSDSDSSIVAQAPVAAGVTISGERPRLNLSDAQLEQLRALKDKNFEANAMKKTQLQILKHQLRSEMTKENVERSAVLSIQSKINAVQADLANTRISAMLDAQAVFTPEQKKMMHERMLRGGFGHHGRGGHCGGGKHGGPGGFRGHGGPGGHGFGGRAEGPEGPFAPQLGEGPEPQFEMPQAEMPDMPDTDGIDS